MPEETMAEPTDTTDPFEAIPAADRHTPIRRAARGRKARTEGPLGAKNTGQPTDAPGGVLKKKRKKPRNLEADTRKWHVERGYDYFKVERHNAFSGKKVDAFGFADAVALGLSEFVLVQTCRKSGAVEHLRRALTGEYSHNTGQGTKSFPSSVALEKLWSSGGKFRMMCWHQVGAGKVWTPIVLDVTFELCARFKTDGMKKIHWEELKNG